jgi:hypothetical protein
VYGLIYVICVFLDYNDCNYNFIFKFIFYHYYDCGGGFISEYIVHYLCLVLFLIFPFCFVLLESLALLPSTLLDPLFFDKLVATQITHFVWSTKSLFLNAFYLLNIFYLLNALLYLYYVFLVSLTPHPINLNRYPVLRKMVKRVFNTLSL